MFEQIFNRLPIVVKNVIIVTVLAALADFILAKQHVYLHDYLPVLSPASPNFKPYQLVTYMFAHGGFMHLAMNMLILGMFGSTVERAWGAKRFFGYYFLSGIGAALIYFLIKFIHLNHLAGAMTLTEMTDIIQQGTALLREGKVFTDPLKHEIVMATNSPLLGASGATFAVMLAFVLQDPDREIQLLLFPMPVKAKYPFMIYGTWEIFRGISMAEGDRIAHFAHFGGIVAGFIIYNIYEFQDKRRR